MSNTQVEILRVFNARPEQIWTAWTNPGWMIKWFGSDPKGFGKRAESNLSVGGHFEVEFATSSGDVFVCMGEYEAVDAPNKLTFTWRWCGRENWTEHVHIELRPDGDGTSMRFVHADIDPATIHGYREGWESTFRKLDAVFAENTAKNGSA